jgi:hypothetical protein
MKDLNGALSYFASQSGNGSFDNPFDSSPAEKDTSSIKIKSFIEDVDERRQEKKQKQKKDKFSRVIEQGNSIIDKFADETIVDDFDEFITSYIYEDEDVSLRNSLVSLGRKYARDTRISGESSEIAKAYSGNEKILTDALKEIEKDSADIQKDIVSMRTMRTRNYKVLSELIDTKAQFHNTKLSFVKELNSIIKTKLELQMKDKARQDGDSEANSNRSIQTLFGLGRNNILSSVGGYSGVSGAISDDVSASMDDDYGINDDDLIQKKYFSSVDNETDGDKFLRYENRGVKYVLLVDENNQYNVIAEDMDGEIIYDYPMPTNVDSLSFDI